MVVEIIVSVILLLVGIAVLVVIHVCIVGRAFRRDYENGVGVASISVIVQRNPSMSPEDIRELLPCFDYKIEEQGKEQMDSCAVCLENYKVGDKCRLLPSCNHKFHSQCIDSWLLKTAACPICRTSANSPKIQDQSCSSCEIEAS